MTPLQQKIQTIRSERSAEHHRKRDEVERTIRDIRNMLEGFDHCRRGDAIDILHGGNEFTIEVKPGPANIWMYRNGELIFGGTPWNCLEDSLANLLA